MPSIKLKSSDNVIYTIDIEAIKLFGTIVTMFDSGVEWTEGMVVPIPEVNSATLGKVVEWVMHHKDDPEPTEENTGYRNQSVISSWDENFLKVDQSALFDLLKAANYLDIKVLFHMICKTVANMIHNKTPQQIRKHFNIKNDLTKEK